MFGRHKRRPERPAFAFRRQNKCELDRTPPGEDSARVRFGSSEGPSGGGRRALSMQDSH